MPGRRVGGRGLRQRLRVPRRRGARAGGVREEHPVRALGRASRPTTRTTRSRSSGREAEDFRVDTFDVSYGDPQTVAVVAKRALRRPAHALPHQRRPDAHRAASPSGTAVSATATRTTTTTPSSAAWCAAPTGRRRDGLVQRRGGSPRRDREVESERFTYTVAARHRRRRAGDRQRGLHRRQPDLPGGHQRAQVRARARRRGRGGRLRRRRLGRRRPGRAARPRRARPLRRGASGTSATTGSRRTPRTSSSARRSGSCPTSRWPSASSTSRWRCATTSTTAASWSTPARRRSTRACSGSATPSAASTTGSTATRPPSA